MLGLGTGAAARVLAHVHILTFHGLHSDLEDGVILVKLALHHSTKFSCGRKKKDIDIRSNIAPMGEVFSALG